MFYYKLVRDKIPQILAASRDVYYYKTQRIPSDEEYKVFLENKLREEVDEYLDSGHLGEFADILEVLYAIAELHGFSPETLELWRQIKKKERGGFKERILLIEVRNREEDKHN